jgi:hypothetical protein
MVRTLTSVADDATYEAVRAAYLAHVAYGRGGRARGRTGSGVAAKAQRATDVLQRVADARGTELAEVLLTSELVPLDPALDTVTRLAAGDRRLAWKLDRFLRTVRRDSRLGHAVQARAASAVEAVPPGLVGAHLVEMCEGYRAVIDETGSGRGRREKKARRREAEDILCRNLSAFQMLVRARRDADAGAELATAAVAGIT